MAAIYKLTYKDAKGVLWIAKITDRNNPYNIELTQVDNGNGTITVTFTFLPLPGDTSSTAIGYSLDGVNWTSVTGGTNSPRSITIPYAAYSFLFEVHRPGGNEVYYLNNVPATNVLTGTAESIKLRGVNNEEDIHAQVRAKEAVISILSTHQVNLYTFMQGPLYNNRFYVEISVTTETNIVFKGYLSTSDLSEPFLSPRNVLTLTATDKLASLKNVAMVDFNGKNPSGHYTIAKYIAFCLRRTGLSLKINVISNLREEHHTDRTWFDTIYLWSKTWEAEIGTSQDCYTVLQNILRKHGMLWQRNGEWWIRSIDEYDQHPVYISRFTEYGEFIEELDGAAFDKAIKRENPIWFSNKRTIVVPTAQNKHTRLSYKYELPKELICNIDFSRGGYIDDVSATEKRYVLECWTLREGVPGYYGTVDGSTATIHRVFNANQYEIERFAEITSRTSFETNSINDRTYIESEFVYLNQKDKFSVSVDWRLKQGIASGGGRYRILTCVIKGDDGSWWILGTPSDLSGTDNTVQWYNTSGWTTNSGRGRTEIDFDTVDEESWQTVSWDAPPAPVDGKLYLWLNQFDQSSVPDDNKSIQFTNLSFDHIPLINGSYKKFTGHYNKVTQAGDYNDVVDDQVYLGDSPSRLYKGGLLRKVDDDYVLAGLFYSGAVFHDSPPPSGEYFHPFGYIQAFAVMNQSRQCKSVFRANLQGLDAASLDELNQCDLPDYIHSFRINDVSPYSNNRDFMLLGFDMDTRWGGWTATLKEVYHRVNGKVYSDTFESRYES